MTIDWTKPVEMEDGRPVRVLCTDGPGMWPVVVIIDDGDLTRVKADSPGFRNAAPQPVNRHGWVNIYQRSDLAGRLGEVGDIFTDEQAAKGAAVSGCAATIRIEWEEPAK